MDREGGRCCRGGWISRMLCRCEGPVCSHPAPVPSHKAFPSWIRVLSAGRLLEASTWDLSIGTTAQSCQASWLAGQVTCFCTQWHIFLPKGPQAASLLLPWAWLVLIYNLRVCPSPSSIIFSPFPPHLCQQPPLQHQAQVFSLPFKLLPNFSQTHLYSCHVLFPSFTAEIFTKLFFKPTGKYSRLRQCG